MNYNLSPCGGGYKVEVPAKKAEKKATPKVEKKPEVEHSRDSRVPEFVPDFRKEREKVNA